MLGTRLRPASVAVLAVLAAAVAGIAGCGTAGHAAAGSSERAGLPRGSAAGSASSMMVSVHGTARYHRVRSAVGRPPTAPPAAVGHQVYCIAGKIPVPFRRGWLGDCGGATCSSSMAAGSRSDWPGARAFIRPIPPVLVLPCGQPLCCLCLPYWRLNRLNSSGVLPGVSSAPHPVGKDGSSPGKAPPVQVCPMGGAR